MGDNEGVKQQQQVGIESYTLGVIARGDVGRIDIEPWDVSSYVAALALARRGPDEPWGLYAELWGASHVDLEDRLLRTRVGDRWIDFVLMQETWDAWRREWKIWAAEFRGIPPPPLTPEAAERR